MLRTSLLLLLLGLALPASAQLEGMIDVHVHSAPDSMPRSIDAFATAREAKAAGMRAIVLKNHYTQTAGMAYMTSQVVPGIEVYGGIALNRAVGGLNPAAIDQMSKTTGNPGRIVWFPTYDSEQYTHTVGPNPNFVPVAANGKLLPEALTVLQTIKDHDLAMATGHSSPEESLLLVKAARDIGIERMIVTHPDLALIGMNREQQREAAGMGAYLEYCIGFALKNDKVFNEFIAAFADLGAEHIIISTDLGQPGNPSHTEGLRNFVNRALAAGVSKADLDLMLKVNPAHLLNLPQQ